MLATAPRLAQNGFEEFGKVAMLVRSSVRSPGLTKPPQKFDELVRQIAESDTFRSAPAMRALLVYLWEHLGEPISEYGIATEALGRDPQFDPRTDSTVRVHIARLRTKLKEFYEAAGGSFPLRLTLPLGSHELHWVYEPPQTFFRSKFSNVPRRYLWATGITGLALIASCVVLAIQVHLLRAEAPYLTPFPRFWQSFLIANKPTVIVVPSPLYFAWPAHRIYIRDFGVTDYSDWPNSPVLKDLGQKWGAPELSQQYVGAMEMTAGVRLLQYLEKGGQQVHLIESRRFPVDSFAAQNTIFLGMPRTAGYLNRMLDKTNFYLTGNNADIVRNRNPRPGEPVEYREIVYASDRRMAPAIVTLLPARPEHTRMLLLLGRNLTSITSMLLTAEGLRLLDDQWSKIGSPSAWEMVIEAEIYRDTVLRVSPVTCRAISSAFWKQD
jgi:Transcriptional regulatory protein, C terminal